jgi:hypothetical protein
MIVAESALPEIAARVLQRATIEAAEKPSKRIPANLALLQLASTRQRPPSLAAISGRTRTNP